MAVDRRASASKTLAARKKKEEQEKARKAVLTAAKRDVENAKSQVGAKERPAYRTGMKNANAGKAPDKTVKSPVKESTKKSSYRTGMKNANAGKTSDRTVKSPVNLPTSYRQSFLTPVALPTQQNNGTQSIKKTMQGRSEDYARLENRKAGADEATRKKIEAAQKKLHEQNVQDARKIGAAFHTSGAWMQKGKPLYQANVLPGQSKAEQIEGTKKSLAAQILSPSQQETIAEYEKRNRQLDALERVKKTITGAGKLYAGSTENALGLGVTGRNEGRKQEDEREIEVWKDEIQRWKQSLKDWEADGSLTEDEREELNRLIEVNQKKIDTYYQAHGAQKKAAEELYRSADKLAQSGAEDIGRAKEGLGNAGQTLVDVGVGGAQLAGDIALGGVAPMFLRSVGGSAQQARQEGATHSQQVNYGMLSGAVGILSEKISNVAGPLNKAFGKGAADDLLQGAINKAVSKLAGSEAGEKILGAIAKQGVNALGEGFEEGLEAAIDPVLKRMTYDPNAQLELADVIHDSIVGAGVGLAAGTGGEVVQNTINGALGLPGKIAEKTQGTKPAPLPTVTTRETETVQPKPLPVQEMQDSQTFGQDAAAQMQGLPVQTAQETETVQPKPLPVETAQDTETVKPRPVQGMQDTYGQAGSYDDFMRPLTGLRDKLASDLQNARRGLPGPGTESRIRELESGLTDVKNKIAAMEKNRPQFTEAQRIAETLGAKFQIADLGAASGRYENGTITVNPYMENPVRQVLVHELTHYIETRDNYIELSNRVMEFIRKEMNTDVKAMRDEIIRDYARYGVRLDEDGAKRELIAKFCEEKLFTDEKSIQRLAETDRGLFQRIRQWISDTIAKLRGTRQQNALREMERLYEKAARSYEVESGYNGAQYAFNSDNTPDHIGAIALLRENLPNMEDMNAVAKVDGTEILREGRATDRAMEYINRIGGKVTRAGFGDVIFTRSRIKGSLIGHGFGESKIELLAGVPGVIRDGVQIGYQSNWKGRGYDSYVFAAPVEYKGQPVYLTAIVVKDRNSNRYYLHEAIDQDGNLLYGTEKSPETASDRPANKSQDTVAESELDTTIIHDTGENSNLSGQNSMGLSFGELRDNVHGMRESRSDVALQGEVRNLMDAWNAKKRAEKQAERIRNGLTLTKRDIMLAQTAAKSGVDTINWEQADNPEPAFLYSKALADVREVDRPIREFMAKRQEELQNNAREAADWIATFAKDKRFGFSYQRETMERNIRDIFGKQNQDVANLIIRDYITPVHAAVAEGNRIKNRYRERVKVLKLSEHESALVQMQLENESGAAAEYIENNNIRVTSEMNERINHAVEEFRAIYNDLYQQINTTLLRNGQEPAPFRKNYAPHFVKDKPDTLLGKIRFSLGLGKDSSLSLPTDIAGITDEFRPGKKWFGNLLQREGEITDYDAVAGFDRYIETAADVITLTDSIQRLRALEDETRYVLSDEAVKDKIDAIRADGALDPLEQRRQMEEIYSDNPTTVQQLIADLQNQKRMGMGGFVTELRRYTDNLAGKKSKEDRGWEQALNRQVYTIAKNMEGRVAANMIALNPASWMTNFIPITQASGEVSTVNLLAGMKDTVKAFVKDDGFADASDFLTNREGSSRLDQTLKERVSGAAGAGMELVDRIASQTIVRGRYRQNVQNGMDMISAIEDADAFAAGLMADRSKGAQPTLFNATNPVTKTFTMFQIEVNNQLSYLFKDMPQAQKQKGVAAVAWAYTKVFVGAHAFNIVFHALTGRDAAFDPVGWILEALGIDDVAWIMDKLGVGDGDDEDEDKKERTGFDIAESLGKNVAENLPFVGGLLGGGRVPIQAALPGLGTMYESWKSDAAPEKKAQTIGKELSKSATYLLPPFGGGAVRRAVEGYQAVKQGGVYGMDNEGNKTLNFPIYGQGVKDYAQAMLFGKYSLPTGQKYVESGFEGRLNADNTRTFQELVRGGMEPQTAYDSIRAITSAKAPEDGSKTETQVRREVIMGLPLSLTDKNELASWFAKNGDLVSYVDEDSFDITSSLPARQQAAAFRLMREQGMSTEQAKEYAALVDETGATYTKGEDGHYTKDSKGVRLKKAYETIQADENLSEEQKNGVVRAVVLSELGEKYTGQYAEKFVGDIETTKLIDAQAAYEQIYNEVQKDTTIHENNRDEFVRLRFAEYLKGTGLNFQQRESLWYFQSHNENDFQKPWSEIIRGTTPSDQEERTRKQNALRGLQDSGMDESTYKVIKAGMGRVFADKDANGETVDGSRKRKLIEYLNQYEDLTYEQKNMLMKTDTYKYGMGEKPKSGSSKKKNPFVLPTPDKMPSLKSLIPF